MIEIQRLNDNTGRTVYAIWESASEQYVNSFHTYKEARTYARFLKRGGGFIDFTPAFMTNKIETEIEIEKDDVDEVE